MPLGEVERYLSGNEGEARIDAFDSLNKRKGHSAEDTLFKK